MPIHECDPWREQYFEGVCCPEDLDIPTDDALAYKLEPSHRWLYNKLLVARSQGLECGVPSRPPTAYPVFSKPITNLEGMGVGSHIVRNSGDFQRYCRADSFWTELLTGDHVSTDWALVRGEPVWCRHTRGIPAPGGTFDYWIIEAGTRPELEAYSREWIGHFLPDYTGMLNVESIGGRIIEVHLRFSDQWPDLYGAGWLDAMVGLYRHHRWRFDESHRTEGFSVVLFGPHGVSYSHPSAQKLRAYRAAHAVSSVQITFSEQRPASAHAMPPGGFRLAIINCTELDAGLQLRAEMAADFGLQETELGQRLAG